MANSLLITKETGGYFSFVLNGNTAKKIQSIGNDLLIDSTQCHFKTKNGANIVKEQSIYPADVTLVANGTFTFSNTTQLWNKLIEVGYFSEFEGLGKLDKDGYTGTAQILDDRITVLEESDGGIGLPIDIADVTGLDTELSEKENQLNKQNSLAIDGTGLKYPTVDAINAVLPASYSKIVYVNNTNLNSATIFDLENPPLVNDDLLKNDVANLYIGTDASTWVYNGSTYVTKSVTSSTSNFYLTGTTTDAGGNKTASINRSGGVGASEFRSYQASSSFYTSLNTDLSVLKTGLKRSNADFFVYFKTNTGATVLESTFLNQPIQFLYMGTELARLTSTGIFSLATLPATSAGTYDFLTRNTSTGVVEKVLSSSLATSSALTSGLAAKQNTLVSGTNIKTINGNSILGSGDIVVGGGLTPDLQTVLDTGAFAELVNPSDPTSLTGLGFNYNLGTENNVYIYSEKGNDSATYGADNGKIVITQQDKSVFKTTEINILSPIADTFLKFPANTTAGTYIIDTTAETIFTVATLPSGTLNQKAIVSDALNPTFLGALVGGGSVVCPVWHNGTTWVSR